MGTLNAPRRLRALGGSLEGPAERILRDKAPSMNGQGSRLLSPFPWSLRFRPRRFDAALS